MFSMRHTGSLIRRGFTLIELLVASAVMAVLVLMVVGLTDNVLNLWGNASGRLASNAEARIALEYLGDDIETMVVRSARKQAWLEVQYEQGADANAPKIMLTLITATEHHDRQETVDGKLSAGNVCAVHYRLAYQNAVMQDTTTPISTYGIYRTVLDPRNTFEKIMDEEFDGGYDTGTLSKMYTLAGGKAAFDSSATSFAYYLCSNIAELTVIFYAENLDSSTGDVDIVPLKQGLTEAGAPQDFIYADGIYFLNGTTATFQENLGSIVFADIRMVVLSDRGAKQIAALSPSDTARKAELIQSEGVVFTRRVPIMSRR